MTDGILPSSPQPASLEIKAGILTFRPRFDDFEWGCHFRGDLVSALGYRIYVARFEDRWYLVDANKRRTGPFRDLQAAADKADAYAQRRIELGLTDKERAELAKA